MPLLLDLFCGRGGWTEAALALGWSAIGIDTHDHGYPADLRLAALPLSPRELDAFGADLIVASPPCEEYARHHLPWLAGPPPDLTLLRWAISLHGATAAPVVVECSLFATRHFPGARIAGSYALWGDVPALLPAVPRSKTRCTGADPARRAMIPAALAGWIIETAATADRRHAAAR